MALPSKKRMGQIADRLWAWAVRSDWGNKCVKCGKRESLNAHHLLPRQHRKTRYELRNGICLCAHCHQFDPEGPHQNAAAWMDWLLFNECGVHGWYTQQIEDGGYRNFTGTVNKTYYCEVIQGLRQYVDPDVFREYVGVGFSEYLNNQD